MHDEYLLDCRIAAITIYLAYNFYARRIDRDVVQSDARRATPARLYMDGVDFMPTSKSVLYGYHFKSIAAAGPIVGVITAANLWGWLPALLWLVVGVSFIGWASDYSAIMVSVRNDGNSLSAISYRLIAPRTRTILFVFIFFYLLLVAGAFMGIMAALMAARPDVTFGIIALGVMGFLAGQMLYRWKMDLILVTVITVTLTLGAMLVGPLGNATVNNQPVYGPVSGVASGLNNAVNSISGGRALFSVVDPTAADPRIPAPNAQGVRTSTAVYNAQTGAIATLPSYLFWAFFLLVFAYLAATLPIWRFAQPVNYIGFWITLITIGLAAIGAILAPLVRPAVGTFTLAPVIPGMGFTAVAGKAWQPLWPMLFVTIACGAISGWHALFGSVGTARQLEYETDGLPVGGGAMFTENTLALLSLVAVSIPGVGGGAGRFAAGVGSLLAVIFGPAFLPYGTALGFGVFMVIVLTVTQLVFRVMSVTLSEWVGEAVPVLRNVHISTSFSMLLTMALVLTGTWVYLWQMFGAANQLMAALSLLIVAVWLQSQRRNPAFALYPMLFMYITTVAATLVTARNLYVTSNLWAQEIDADSHIKAYQNEIRQKILDMYGFDQVPDEIEQYIQAASAEPAMEESAIFDAVVDIVVQGSYDYYIYDLVPLGHALYYLSMAKVYDEWIAKITHLREEMREYEEMVSRLKREKQTEEDQILSELQYIRSRISASSRILTDREKTAFFFVVIPEEMILIDTQKAAGLFAQFNVPIAGYVVNRVVPRELLDQDIPSYLRNRIEMQDRYLVQIDQMFGRQVAARVPELERDVTGLPMIETLAGIMYGNGSAS